MTPPDIRYEFSSKPESGQALAIAEGVMWVRMPLPFALNHINLWLLRDGDGWTLVDTGLGDETTQAHWQSLFASPLDRLTRIIVTHLHPDHVGCAGHLARQFDAPLWMTREEYLLCRVLVADTGREAPLEGIAFYRAAGYPDEALERYRRMFGQFGRYVARLPEAYCRLVDRRQVAIGGSDWEVVIGRGHSPEHACLYNAERNFVLGGDQLLPAISANVSVYPTEPDADPLSEWLASLAAIRARLPQDVLVLPAHGKPYRGVHARIDALLAHHQDRLDALLDYCGEPRRAVDVFPALYHRAIRPDNLMFATGEAIAHLNTLIGRGEVQRERDSHGILWYQRR